jgi:polyvinyl alcohol dehydrogenase (cytochrome)
MAQLAAQDVPRLKLKWAFGFPGATSAFAQPTIFGGRLFVGSQGGKVYSLDANSGCAYWRFDAGAGVRTAIVIGPRTDGWSAYFGDFGANVHAVDALTGKALWRTQVEGHPAARITGAPTLVGTTLFVPVSSIEEATGASPAYGCCTFRGSIVALEASTGKLLWKSYTIAQEPTPGAVNAAGVQLMGPSGAAIWSSPTFDAATHRIYVTTGDNYSDPPTDTSDAILAFDADSGALAWSRQTTSGDAYNIACSRTARDNCPRADGPDLDYGSSAILVDLPRGKRALIGAQKSGVVTALDPDHGGEILWQTRVGRGGKLGGVEWGAAADQNKLYVAVSDAKLISVAVDSAGDPGLNALNLDTGEVAWKTPHPSCNGVPGCDPAQAAAVTAIPGAVFSGDLDGHLRAYAAEDGRILWDVDTTGQHHTVNGVTAYGGSINGPGAVVVGGVLYVNSGYGAFGEMPGNVLLAYTVDGR